MSKPHPFDGILKSVLGSDSNAHHVISYNNLVKHHIKNIIEQYGTLGTLLNDIKYDMHIDNISVLADEATADECHEFGLNYTCSIVGDLVLCTSNVDDSFVYRVSTTIARIPLITGRTCLSSSLDTDIYPIIGAYIIRGKLRTIPMTKSIVFDAPVLMTKKKSQFIQVRSRHPLKPYRSTSTFDIRIENNRKKTTSEGVVNVRLAFQTTYIHIAVVVQALGCTPAHFNTLLRLMAGGKYDKKIFCRYEMSMLHNKYTQKSTDVLSAELCVARSTGKNVQSTGHTIVNTETLPHILYPDDKDKERALKVVYLAYCTMLLISITHKLIPETAFPHRDNFQQSQILTSANHMGSLFRMQFISHIRTCGKLLRRALMKLPGPKKTKGARLDLIRVFGEHRLSGRLISSVASGVWSQIRKGVSIALNTNNDDSISMQLRRVSSSMHTTDGTHTRPRNVANDQFGHVCAGWTPDGEQTGLVYELANTTTVTPPVLDRSLLGKIVKDEMSDICMDMADWMYEKLYNTVPQDDKAQQLPGAIVFDAENAPTLMMKSGISVDVFIGRFRLLRRRLSISPFSFVNRDVSSGFVFTRQDEGLLTRPLVVRETYEQIHSEMTLNEALVAGLVEYVSSNEQTTSCKIAMSINNLEEFNDDVTHIELTQSAFLGYSCSSVPFVTSQQGPRNSYFGSQRKQAITAHQKERHGSIATTQLTNSFESLVKPKTETFIPGAGELIATPLVLAFIALEGTEEDAVVFSKTSKEFGALSAHTTRTYTSEAAPPNALFSEVFEKPGEVICKKNTSYEALGDNGLPLIGKQVNGGDIVIGKTRSVRIQNKGLLKQEKFMLNRRDISTTSRRDEHGVVQDSTLSTLPTGTRANVTIRTERELIVGDKVTSRFAQKSTISSFWNRADMPVSEVTGMSPDIIASPLCLSSRMTMGSLIEALTGKAVCVSGEKHLGIDDQQFDISNKVHVAEIGKILKSYGFDSGGTETYIDGRSGEIIEGMVFTGVVDYLRLVHLAEKKLHARSTGKRDVLTRQPTDGRRACGGLRFGDMEVSAAASSGASINLQDRFLKFSDAFDVFICKRCSTLVDLANPNVDFFYCTNCETDSTVRSVCLPFTFLVLMLELQATHVSIKLELKDDNTVIGLGPL